MHRIGARDSSQADRDCENLNTERRRSSPGQRNPGWTAPECHQNNVCQLVYELRLIFIRISHFPAAFCMSPFPFRNAFARVFPSTFVFNFTLISFQCPLPSPRMQNYAKILTAAKCPQKSGKSLVKSETRVFA